MGAAVEGGKGSQRHRGPSDNAAIIKSGLSSEDIPEIDQTIALLREQGNGETPRAKILRMLEGCGASQTPGDIVEAQSILYRGQAAALMAVDRRWSGRFKEDDDLVDRVLSPSAADAAPIISTAPLQNAAPIDSSGIDRVASVPQVPIVQAAIHRPPVSILALADRLIEEKAKLNEWRPKTQAQVRSVAELFVKMIAEILYETKPRSLLVVGSLAEFRTERGTNEPKNPSFEMYRRNVDEPEIITFDEFYHRAKYIIEHHE